MRAEAESSSRGSLPRTEYRRFEPHENVVVLRLDVDVAGAFFNGKGEDIVGEANNRRVLGSRSQIHRIGFLFLFLLHLESAENFVLQLFETLQLKFGGRFLFTLLVAFFFSPSVGFTLFRR